MLPLTPASERILCESVGDNNEEVGESGSPYLRPLRHCMYRPPSNKDRWCTG